MILLEIKIDMVPVLYGTSTGIELVMFLSQFDDYSLLKKYHKKE